LIQPQTAINPSGLYGEKKGVQFKMLKRKKLLFQGGIILDIQAKSDKMADILVTNGRIEKIGKIKTADFDGRIIDVRDHFIAPGLIDMHVHLREPGREDEETIESGCLAAAAGGFTAVCCMPNTDPVCDKQEVVNFIKSAAQNLAVDVYPIAAVTKRRAGKEITEMAELAKAGAVAFTDDGNPVSDTTVMRRALEYSSMYGKPIIDHCEDPSLFAGGHMHEGLMSTKLGLPGIPDICESIMIARDISLSRFTGGRIHIAHISTKKGVDLVRAAKREGVQITCEVTPHHLTFTDEDLCDYNTDLKMNPPLRSKEDVDALYAGLADGTIDVIASDHAPHSIEEKDVEFLAAPFGIIGLETMLAAILTYIVRPGLLSLAEALHKMSIAPRQILSIPIPKIRVGEQANFSVFHPEQEWKVDCSRFKSLSRNTPYNGTTLYGKVKGVYNHKQWSAF
jgi:dihydroorotase